jgi:hypothetical protein
MKCVEKVVIIVVIVFLCAIIGCLVVGAYRVKSAMTHAWWGKDYKETTQDMIWIDDAVPVPSHASTEYNRDEALLHADIISRIEKAESTKSELDMHPLLREYSLVGRMGVHAEKGRVSRIAFRGTSTSKEMRENMNYAQVPFLGTEARVHRGFLRTYETLHQADVLKAAARAWEHGHTLVISGHSLGAAIANMAALDVAAHYPDLTVVVYAFAPPKQGDAAYARMLSSTRNLTAHQLINMDDLVTSLPLPVTPNLINPSKPYLYEHGGVQHIFNYAEPRRFLVDIHLLTAYQPNL